MFNPLGHITLKRIIVFSILIACIIASDYLGFFEGINNYLYDLSFRIRGASSPAGNILLVNIDDKTLERLGRWPLKRKNYALLIDKIADADVILFDIIMAEPTEDDAFFAKSLKKHGRVILPVMIENNKTIRYPVASLSANHIGHVHVEQGVDGIVRDIYHTLIFQNTILPSITSEAYRLFLKKPSRQENILQRGTQESRITQIDRMRINFVGGPGSFENISFVDVIDNYYPPTFFKNKIVLVGLSATGLGDVIMTPFSQDRKGTPGVEGQASILNTLLLNNPIKDVAVLARWLITWILAIVSFLFFMKVTEKWAAVAGLILVLSICISTYIFFRVFDLWIAPTIYYAGIFFVFILSYIFKFDESISVLDRAYRTLAPNLRWNLGSLAKEDLKVGISGMLTERGIQSKVKILTDVGRQLSFEKELTDRALLSNVHGVLIFGPDRDNIMINELARNMLQENSIDTYSVDALIKSFEPLIIEKIKPEDILSRVYSEQFTASFTISLAKKRQSYFKVDVSSFSVDDRRYLLVLLSDITKIKELEILKGHIISVVSHELKTPLTSIQGFSEILSKNLEGKMQNFAGIIHRESERLARFLNTFLDITRIEEGRQPIKITSVNLKSVAEEVASALKPIGDTNRISIDTDLPEMIDDIMVDRDLTKQCIFNLVENAIKYSPSGKNVIIKLTDEQNQLKIDIIDHGHGIKKEDIGRVFEKFFRSSSDKTKNIKGSGLGLTFVKEAVEAQGGRLSLESVYGEGSTFTITFPRSNKAV